MYSCVRPSAHEQQRLTLGPLAAVQVLHAAGRYICVQLLFVQVAMRAAEAGTQESTAVVGNNARPSAFKMVLSVVAVWADVSARQLAKVGCCF